ncbi:MAG: hypothetical protein M3R36_07805 [Bacteroidota bacterium]|nr:hypothetical protein [Bacteroidota bacterium]
MFAAALSFNLVLQHAVKAKLFHPSHSDERLRQSIKRGMLVPVVYFISILGALISVYISLSIFILIPVMYFIPQKIVRLDED